jgi:hypothetical protein
MQSEPHTWLCDYIKSMPNTCGIAHLHEKPVAQQKPRRK